MNNAHTDGERKVNIFIAGAPKCGTTSLATWLALSPDISTGTIKEPHFFSQTTASDSYYRVLVFNRQEEYLKNYQEECRVWIDCSTSYMHDTESPQKIFKYNPLCKIIFILRDPIERAISHYLMDLRLGYVTSSLEAALQQPELKDQYIGRSEYSSAIKNWRSSAEKSGSEILLIKYESLFRNDKKLDFSVMKMLTGEMPKGRLCDIKENDFGAPRGQAIFCARQLHLDALGKFLPKKLKKMMWSALTKRGKKPSLHSEREILKLKLREEVEWFEHVFSEDDIVRLT